VHLDVEAFIAINQANQHQQHQQHHINITHTTHDSVTVMGRDIGEESARPGANATGGRGGGAPAEGGAPQQRM
jgi:hypothetical protein